MKQNNVEGKRVIKVKKTPKTKKYYLKEGIRKLVMIAALFCFSYVFFELTNIYIDYIDADNAYANINDMLDGSDDGDDKNNKNKKNNKVELKNKNESDKWEWDYDSYLKFNSDTKGFIMCEGTPIQYPIMQGKDNDYYLTHLANNIESKNGSIYIDYKIDLGLEARNCVVYGHNMRNDSMFGSLQKYADESYCKEHPYMDVYIGYDHYKYYVFAAYSTPIKDTDTYKIRFGSDPEFRDYIKSCKNKSIYLPYDGKITVNDKILTLSTCMDNNDENYRFIVQLVRGEKVDD